MCRNLRGNAGWADPPRSCIMTYPYDDEERATAGSSCASASRRVSVETEGGGPHTYTYIRSCFQKHEIQRPAPSIYPDAPCVDGTLPRSLHIASHSPSPSPSIPGFRSTLTLAHTLTLILTLTLTLTLLLTLTLSLTPI